MKETEWETQAGNAPEKVFELQGAYKEAGEFSSEGTVCGKASDGNRLGMLPGRMEAKRRENVRSMKWKEFKKEKNKTKQCRHSQTLLAMVRT